MLMRPFFFLIILISFQNSAMAQALKMNEFAALIQKHHVSERLSFETTATDSIYLEQLIFREDGLVSQQIGYFAGKRKLFKQHFEYDPQGKLVSSSVEHAMNGWEVVPINHTFNALGQLVRRECPQEIKNFWAKEEYIYDEKGKLIACERYGREGEEYLFLEKESYSYQFYSGENTPSYIHDEKGLLVMQQIKSAATRGNGASKRYLYR